MKNNYIFLLCFFLLSASLQGQFINCNNSVNLSLDFNGEGILTPNMFLEGINPDDLDSIWLDIDYVNCDNIGSPIIITVYGELDGTLDSCTTELTVEDKFAPIAIVDGNGILVDVTGGPVNLDPMLIDDGSHDNCEIVSYVLEPSVIDCNSPNPTLVTLTVFDPGGNSSFAVTEVIPVGDFNQYGSAMACNFIGDLNVINGPIEIVLEDVLEAGPSVCLSNYFMEIENTDSSGPTPSDNVFTENHVGYTYTITIYDTFSFQSCWSSVTIVDGSETYGFCAQDFNGNDLSDVFINNYSTDETGCTTVLVNAGSLVKPEKFDAPLKGVDIIDVLLMKAFILDVIDLDVYQKFASDVNGDGQVSDDDIIYLFEIFLGQSTLDQSWYFHNSDVPLTGNEIQSTIDETILIDADLLNYNYTGIKIGDIDLSHDFNFSSNESTSLTVKDIVLNKGETHMFDLSISEAADIYSFEINISEETEDYKILSVSSNIPGFAFNVDTDISEGQIKIDWMASDEAIQASGVNVLKDEAILTFEIAAKENSILSNSFALSEQKESRIVSDGILNSTRNIEIEIDDKITVPVFSIEQVNFSLTPNPASDIINLESDENLNDLKYYIYNVAGGIVQEGNLQSTYVDISNIENGLYYIYIKNDIISHSQKLMIIR